VDDCCVLTGYCIDYDILKPLYDFIKTPNDSETLEDILYDCLQSWVYACQDDYETQRSFEYVSEFLDANNFEFTENGELY
jgi:hypothetical protein